MQDKAGFQSLKREANNALQETDRIQQKIAEARLRRQQMLQDLPNDVIAY